MPAGRGNSQTVHIGPVGDIEDLNISALERPGELGQYVQGTNNKGYQLVQCDSGATASTPRGIVARGHLAFWMAKGGTANPYRVTNDIRTALGGGAGTSDQKRNNVAGVFLNAVTAGYYTAIQIKGNMSAVFSDGGADWLIGDSVIAAASTNADVDRIAAGTAAVPGYVGEAAGTESGGLLSTDLDLPIVP